MFPKGNEVSFEVPVAPQSTIKCLASPHCISWAVCNAQSTFVSGLPKLLRRIAVTIFIIIVSYLMIHTLGGRYIISAMATVPLHFER